MSNKNLCNHRFMNSAMNQSGTIDLVTLLKNLGNKDSQILQFI